MWRMVHRGEEWIERKEREVQTRNGWKGRREDRNARIEETRRGGWCRRKRGTNRKDGEREIKTRNEWKGGKEDRKGRIEETRRGG